MNFLYSVHVVFGILVLLFAVGLVLFHWKGPRRP